MSKKKKTKFIVRFENVEGRSCLGKYIYLAFHGEHRGGWDICGLSRDAHRFDSREDVQKRVRLTKDFRLVTRDGYVMQVIPAWPTDVTSWA